MSPLIRGGLFMAGFAGAVGLGYALKPIPQHTKAAPPPTIVLKVPEAPTPPSTVLLPPKIESGAEFVIPPPSGRDVTAEPVNKNDVAFQMIAKEIGIKSTLDDKPAGGPVVPAGANSLPPLPTLPPAANDTPPTVAPPMPPSGPSSDQFKDPPASGDITPPRIEVTPPPPEPMPRLDAVPPPPGLDISRIPDVPLPPPAAPAKLILNTRPVSFNFEVTKVGPSQVKAVELWATRDGGKTWEKYDRMLGDKPPFKTHLGGEGEYGFKVVFESESGKRTREPEAGAAPDIRVELDQTPPTVELTPFLTVPRPGADPSAVEIQFTLADRNLEVSATRLEYSADGTHWHAMKLARPIAADYKAAAPRVFCRAEWSIPVGLPHNLFVRITARDHAGNEATARIPKQLSVDLVVPEGKLTGVEPQRAGQIGPMPRVVPTPPISTTWTGSGLLMKW